MLFKFLRMAHSWGGFILALILIMVSLSGSLLVWKKEYLWLTMPEVRSHETVTPTLAANLLVAAQQHFPDREIQVLSFNLHNLGLHKIWLGNYDYAYLDNQGEVLDSWHLNERIEELIYDFHHRLLLEDIGLLIAGLSALVMLGLIPAGITLWWPARKRFRWRLWRKGWHRAKLLATHQNLGIIAALPIMFALLTGIILSFPDESRSVLVEPFNQSEQYSALYEQKLDQVSGAESAEYLPAFERALSSFPGAQLRSIMPSNFVSEQHLIMLQKPGDWHQSGLNRVYIDTYDGAMNMRLDAGLLPPTERFYNASYPLHTGKLDSIWYKIFVTLTGLCLCLLCLLGMLSFWKKLRN